MGSCRSARRHRGAPGPGLPKLCARRGLGGAQQVRRWPGEGRGGAWGGDSLNPVSGRLAPSSLLPLDAGCGCRRGARAGAVRSAPRPRPGPRRAGPRPGPSFLRLARGSGSRRALSWEAGKQRALFSATRLPAELFFAIRPHPRHTRSHTRARTHTHTHAGTDLSGSLRAESPGAERSRARRATLCHRRRTSGSRLRSHALHRPPSSPSS